MNDCVRMVSGDCQPVVVLKQGITLTPTLDLDLDPNPARALGPTPSSAPAQMLRYLSHDEGVVPRRIVVDVGDPPRVAIPNILGDDAVAVL